MILDLGFTTYGIRDSENVIFEFVFVYFGIVFYIDMILKPNDLVFLEARISA